MIYKVFVKGFDLYIEEEVIFEIEGIEFIGFFFVCFYEIEVGKKYFVLVGFMILDELVICENKEKIKELDWIGLGY